MSLFRRTKNGNYYYKFTIKHIEYVKSTGTKDKILAGEVEEKVYREALLGKSSKDNRMTLVQAFDRAYIELWIDHKDGEKVYRRCTKIVKLLGALTLEEITTVKVEELKAILRKENKQGSTINRYLSTLKTTLRLACLKWRAIETMPLITTYKETSRIRVITKLEERTIIDTLKDEQPLEADLVQCLIDTGCRVGELLKIRANMIDFDDNCFYLPATITKTTAARSVPMTDRCSRILKQTIEGDAIGSHDLVFSKISQDRFNKIWRKMRIKLGMDDDKEFVPHALRHTAATRFLNKDVDIRVVQRVLGHATITTTQKYTHVSQDRLQDAVKKLQS